MRANFPLPSSVRLASIAWEQHVTSAVHTLRLLPTNQSVQFYTPVLHIISQFTPTTQRRVKQQRTHEWIDRPGLARLGPPADMPRPI